jgi:hypothetical protein
MLPANLYVIRCATEADSEALDRIAALDSQRPLTGDILVAQREGVLVAALSLDENRVVANPFEPTAVAVGVLHTRAGALRAVEQEPSLPRRLLAAVRVPTRAAFGSSRG